MTGEWTYVHTDTRFSFFVVRLLFGKYMLEVLSIRISIIGYFETNRFLSEELNWLNFMIFIPTLIIISE